MPTTANIQVKNIINQLNLRGIEYGGRQCYQLDNIVDETTIQEVNVRNKSVKIPKTKMHNMVKQALPNGSSSTTIDTFLHEEVDHDTLPPDGNDYHSWERQSKQYYRKDEITLNITNGNARLSATHIKNDDTGWRF